MFTKKHLSLAVASLAAVTLTACGGGGGSESGDGGGEKLTIGVLFPDNQTPLWENQMWPSVRDNIKKECPDCEVLYGNVAADATQQRNQADSMLAQGADALVLAPVDAASSKVIVDTADAQGVPVIGFASIPEGPVSAFVGVDVTAIGRAQGAALLSALEAGGDPGRGCVVALEGDAKTPATKLFLEGRDEIVGDKVDFCKEYSIENWDPSNAQTAMDQAITLLGRDAIIGVYGMNDGIAGGAFAAMQSAGFEAPFPPIGGQDTDLAAVQRILAGRQAYTVNNLVEEWGTVAAPVALSAARGEELTSDKTEKNTDHEFPWFTTPDPVAVTLDNIQESVIDTGKYSYDEICTPDYKADCDEAGLTPAG